MHSKKMLSPHQIHMENKISSLLESGALCRDGCLRRFVDIDLGREAVADATTLLQFHYLLEKHALGK